MNMTPEQIQQMKENADGIPRDKYTAVLPEDTKNSENLTCCICKELLKCSTELVCGHVYCEDCIASWLEINDKCPMCKHEILDDSDINRSKYIDRMVSEITVRCPYCDWSGEYLNFIDHSDPEKQHFRCKYITTTCVKCLTSVKSERMDIHVKTECEKRVVSCDDCKEDIVFQYAENHKEQTCSETIVKCVDGCDFHGKRKMYDTHKLVCKYEKVECPMKPIGCTAILTRNELYDHLENSGDRHLAIALEHVNDLKIDIDNLKRKLKNYELPPDHIFSVGEMVRFKYEHGFAMGEIQEILDNKKFLIKTDDGNCIKKRRELYLMS